MTKQQREDLYKLMIHSFGDVEEYIIKQDHFLEYTVKLVEAVQKATIESEQVQGLVNALEYYADIDWDNGHENGRASEALEKFRGGE